MDVALALKFIPTAIAATLLWSLARRYVFKHPLDILPGPPALSFITGKSATFVKPLPWMAWNITAGLATNERVLYVSDPKAFSHIFLKEQHIYEESDPFLVSNNAIFGKGLLSTLGNQHKRQRKMLNPVFSVGHMRKMVPTFFKVTYDLRDVLLQKTAKGPQELEMVSWLTRTALEIVALCGLGRSFSPVTGDGEEHKFISSIKLLGPLGRGLILVRQLFLPILVKYKIGTGSMLKSIGLMLPWPTLHKMIDVVDTMHEVSLDIFHSKKKDLEQNKDVDDDEGKRDFLSILMRENAKAEEADRLPDDEVIAQISTLMFAAMDTTSSALSRIIWLLAKHQDVQEKLRAEIREAKERFEEPDYDELAALPYLDAVCKESLRMYPPAPFLSRQARQDAVLPFSKPVKTVNGKEIQEMFVPKDTMLTISIHALNTDPEIWGPDAFEWKPERWLSQLPKSVFDAHVPGVFSHMMTFIGGGRACIGFKFSEMEMKVILYVLVDFFKFELGKQEILWNIQGLTTPCVDRKELRPKLPIVVSRAI
ncbi:cytochrome P450 [Ephemerocybe angulata]|uniref:Cytochrome P450 n=1 Tax=Ephemerocybe angulata TaxID=980116 RepID=A0A8H6IBD5_9AGAR|nr:cytochrome P450 [Tulosesus angulatus]